MAQAARTTGRPRSGALPHARGGRRRRSRARRGALILAIVAAALMGAAAASLITGVGPLGDAVREITLPLRHEDIIRQQAAEKGIDPALIAAVIFEESKFRDQTSHAGARGLMQITPDTANFIARESGGTRFTHSDLATPQVNISYGAYYLRYLLRRYGGDETLAVAAYNAGETNVNRWIERAGGRERFSADEHIAFPETRKYVSGVLDHRDAYREHYKDELGL
jgi:soluble lytic murein transglycosylase